MSDFDPNNLEAMEVALKSIIDIDDLPEFSSKEIIYKRYFDMTKKNESLLDFIKLIKVDMDKIHPLLTHPNKNLQEIFYKSYMKLDGFLKIANAKLPVFELEKNLAIEKFNQYFEMENT